MIETSQQWAARQVSALPGRWQRCILGAWERRRGQDVPGHTFGNIEAEKLANIELRETLDGLESVRVSLDASDAEICERADYLVKRCMSVAQLHRGSVDIRAAMARIASGHGIDPPEGETITDQGAIARMTDAQWWRRQLRRLHARKVEAAAIYLGLVNKARDLYVSNESLHRRQQQNARNAAILEATTAENEDGQQYTMAELAATSTSNKGIRRAELMTRIAGFERIAIDLGHDGVFMTITCPSRMHRWRTVKGGAVIENPKYDGTTPIEANRYLAKVWARARAALARAGLAVYGFRIAEPQHDGTPHWHFLLFHQAGRLDDLRAIVSRYALADSPDEPGAHRHRADFVRMDAAKGTAAGYIAKYVAKNIDGYKVGKDLFDNDAIETSARVEAWAATWGIRQFQQVGGPPVGPWRELRRIKEMPEGAPDHLKAAHRAVNKLAVIEGRDSAAVAWDRYVKAQGGAFVGRSYRIRISYRPAEGVGRYGEPLGAKPVGVETVTKETYTPEHMAWMGGRATRLVTWFVESTRKAWQIVTRAARGVVGMFNGARPQAATPWTCVNNCTRGSDHERNANAPPGAETGRGSLGQGAGHHQSDGRGIRGAYPGADPRGGQ